MARPGPLEKALEEAIDKMHRALLEYEESSAAYDTILDRISGLDPSLYTEGNVLDRRISDAYYRSWRAAEAFERAWADVLRMKARYDAESKMRMATFHGVGPRPWARTPIQRRPVMIPVLPETPARVTTGVGPTVPYYAAQPVRFPFQGFWPY